MTQALPHILRLAESRGHAIFTEGRLNLNIIGVRSPSRVSDQFDDRLYVIYRDEVGEWVEKSWRITTDPGAHYLKHPMRSDGTAILEPGQYRGAYVIGTHKGYPALRQDRPVNVRRDNNRNRELDDGVVTVAPATSRINIHASDLNPFDSIDRERGSIGRWSAGCQVFARSPDYREFWGIVLAAAQVWGPRFTYTLLGSSEGI